MKVLHICSFWSGTQVFKNLANKLIEKKIDITVFEATKKKYVYKNQEKYLIQDPCYRELDFLKLHYKYNKGYNRLLKNVKPEEYDFIHAHSLFADGYITYRISKKYNIPYIVAIRNMDINRFLKKIVFLRKLGIKILENASKIIFISNAYKERLLNNYVPEDKKEKIENKSIILPNGISKYYLENKKAPKTLNKERINLVYTGRIDRNKNLITTIKCCDEILKHKYNIKLTVIGKIFSKKYKKIIKKHNFINYIGPKNKEEIIDIYNKMDIFVMPSKHETFGLVYVEAMSQGLPVIYTENEGFDKFFEEGEVGYGIKYNNYKEMAKKIELIIKNYDEISNNCIKNVDVFNWEDITEKYIQIYENIVKNIKK